MHVCTLPLAVCSYTYSHTQQHYMYKYYCKMTENLLTCETLHHRMFPACVAHYRILAWIQYNSKYQGYSHMYST